MTIDEAPPSLGHAGGSTAYDLRVALHALTGMLDNPPRAKAEQVERLLRAVVDTGRRTLRLGPLPGRPFVYADERRPIGPGAILSELAEAGTTAIGRITAGIDGTLLDELDQLATASDKAGGAPALPFGSPPAPDEIRLALKPIEDWTAVARGVVTFGAADEAPRIDGAELVSTGWNALPAKASSEIARGLENARRLMADFGRLQPSRVAVDIRLDGVLGPSVVPEHSAAASIALSYLAVQTGLSTPAQLSVLPVAGCTIEGTWTRYPQIDSIREVIMREGMWCLWRDENGWRLQTAQGSDSDPDPSLLGAARLLWGDHWSEATRILATETLATHEWDLLHPIAVPGDWLNAERHPVVAPDNVAEMVEWYADRPRSRAILSGNRNSGKSVSARLIAAGLRERGWQTVVIAPTQRLLPDDMETLPVVVEAAMRSARTEASRGPVLVVLEDLLPLQEGNIGAIVSSLGHLDIGVLALARYVDGAATTWHYEGVAFLLAQSRRGDLEDLARRLTIDFPEAYPYGSRESERIDLAVAACRGDLAVLTETLRTDPDARVAGTVTPEDMLESQLTALRELLNDATRPLVCRLAAVSSMDDWIPESHVAALSPEILDLLSLNRRAQLVQIGSRVRAELILETLDSSDLSEAVLRHSARYLERLIAEDDAQRIRALLRHYSVYKTERMRDLLTLPTVMEAVQAWAALCHPPTALRVLRLCHKATRLDWVAAAAATAAARMPEAQDLAVDDLTIALQTLWHSDYQLPKDSTVAKDLLTWIGDEGLGQVLARPSRVSQRYTMAYWMLRYSRRFETTTAVLERLTGHASQFISGADPRHSEDLIHIRRLSEQLDRATESQHMGGGVRIRPLQQPLQGLLKKYPDRDVPLAAVLSWMSLRVHFEGASDWNSLIDQYGHHVRSGLAQADPAQVSAAFSDLAQSNGGMCTRLFNRLDLSAPLTSIVKSASPEAAAMLLSTIRNIHGATVKSMLYRKRNGSWMADSDLVQHLADTVLSLNDVRGAGKLLSAVSRADDLYCDTKERFGYLLTCRLGAGFAKNAVSLRHPPAITYHFLRGLWEAEADYRDDLEDHVLKLVLDSIKAQRGAARPWGPRLAMLLIGDDYFGQDFLARLAGELDANALCGRMCNADLDPQSLLHLHRLGRAMSPGIGEQFKHEISLDRVVRSQFRDSTPRVIEKLRIIAETLRLGGEPHPEALLIGRLRQAAPHWDWAQQLLDVRQASVFSSALDNLRYLDRALATETVQRLTERRRNGSSRLYEMLAENADQPNIVADLLLAVESVWSGKGREGLESLRNRKDRWRVFHDTFSYEQDPILQGITGRKLLRVGFTQRHESERWMSTLVHSRWAATIPSTASPWALAEVLNLCFSWDPAWGEELATRVNQRWLIDRIEQAMRHDLLVVPGLLHILWLCGRDDIAQAIVDRLMPGEPRLLAASLGLRSSTQMMRTLRRTGLQIEGFPEAVAGALTEVMRRPLAVHARDHWNDIGWAAQAIRDAGSAELLPESPPTLAPNTSAFPGQIAWAMTWLPETEHNLTVLDEALERFARSAPDRQNAAWSCMALIASSRAGRITAATPLETDWAEATGTGPELMTLLCREGLRNEVLDGHLGTSRVVTHLRKLLDENERPDLITASCFDELAAQVERLRPDQPETKVSAPDSPNF